MDRGIRQFCYLIAGTPAKAGGLRLFEIGLRLLDDWSTVVGRTTGPDSFGQPQAHEFGEIPRGDRARDSKLGLALGD